MLFKLTFPQTSYQFVSESLENIIHYFLSMPLTIAALSVICVMINLNCYSTIYYCISIFKRAFKMAIYKSATVIHKIAGLLNCKRQVSAYSNHGKTYFIEMIYFHFFNPFTMGTSITKLLSGDV